MTLRKDYHIIFSVRAEFFEKKTDLDLKQLESKFRAVLHLFGATC